MVSRAVRDKSDRSGVTSEEADSRSTAGIENSPRDMGARATCGEVQTMQHQLPHSIFVSKASGVSQPSAGPAGAREAAHG